VLGGRAGKGKESWRAEGDEAACALRLVLQHMRRKRGQAELLLDLLSKGSPSEKSWERAAKRMEELRKGEDRGPRGDALAYLVGGRWMSTQKDFWGEQWATFSGNWPRWGILRGGVVFPQPTWEPPIFGNGSSASPSEEIASMTPCTDGDGSNLAQRGQSSTPPSMRMEDKWRTPTATELRADPDRLEGDPNGRMTDKMTGKVVRHGLPQQSKMWMTPQASDGEGGVMEMREGAAGKYKLRDHAVSEMGNWPTPSRADGESGQTNPSSKRCGGAMHESLRVASSNWPTPRTANISGSKQRQAQGPNPSIKEAAENWPTPRSTDSKEGNPAAGSDGTNLLRETREFMGKPGEMWPTPTADEAGKIGNSANYGQKGLSNHPAIVGQPDRPKGEKSGKWNTPTVSDSKGIDGPKSEARYGTSDMRTSDQRLRNQAGLWPTPNASLFGSSTAADGSRKGFLEQEAQKWPTPKTPTGGGESAERKQELGRTESGGGDLQSSAELWPTPRANDVHGEDPARAENKSGARHAGDNLPTAATKLWRTPSAQEPGISPERLEGGDGHRAYDKETGRLAQYGLTQQAASWPTPQSRDFRSVTGREGEQREHPEQNLNVASAMWPTPSAEGSAGECSEDLERKGAKLVNAKTGRVLQSNLATEAGLWPTPKARDEKNPDSPDAGRSARKREAGWSEDLNDSAARWPTPIVDDTKDPRMSKKLRESGAAPFHLSEAAGSWPTPVAGDAHLSSSPEAAERRLAEGKSTLSRVADSKLWPTPATRDEKGANSEEHFQKEGMERHMGQLANYVAHSPDCPPSPQGQGSGTPGDGSSPSTPGSPRRRSSKPKLNPLFVAWMMGWPLGWANPDVPIARTSSGCSATGSYLSKLRWRLSCLLGG